MKHRWQQPSIGRKWSVKAWRPWLALVLITNSTAACQGLGGAGVRIEDPVATAASVPCESLGSIAPFTAARSDTEESQKIIYEVDTLYERHCEQWQDE